MILQPKQILMLAASMALLLLMACDPSSSACTEKESSKDTVWVHDTIYEPIQDTCGWDSTGYSSSSVSSSSSDTTLEKTSMCMQEPNCLTQPLNPDKYDLAQNGPHRRIDLDTNCDEQCGILKVLPGDTVIILARVMVGDSPNSEWMDYSNNPYQQKTLYQSDCHPWYGSVECWDEYKIIFNNTGGLSYDFYKKFEDPTSIYRGIHILFQQE